MSKHSHHHARSLSNIWPAVVGTDICVPGSTATAPTTTFLNTVQVRHGTTDSREIVTTDLGRRRLSSARSEQLASLLLKYG